MKRIDAECLEQTLHFYYTDGLSVEEGKAYVKQEFEAYKARMERRGVQYKILEETDQPDGTLIVKLKRQNVSRSVGNYLD